MRAETTMNKPIAIIKKYDGGSNKWFISFDDDQYHRPAGWNIPRTAEYWASCPGTLHQDYNSAEEAVKVAEWWGFHAQTA
jgi:hypothetical protein